MKGVLKDLKEALKEKLHPLRKRKWSKKGEKLVEDFFMKAENLGYRVITKPKLIVRVSGGRSYCDYCPKGLMVPARPEIVWRVRKGGKHKRDLFHECGHILYFMNRGSSIGSETEKEVIADALARNVVGEEYEDSLRKIYEGFERENYLKKIKKNDELEERISYTKLLVERVDSQALGGIRNLIEENKNKLDLKKIQELTERYGGSYKEITEKGPEANLEEVVS